jgi:hypothetical protein
VWDGCVLDEDGFTGMDSLTAVKLGGERFDIDALDCGKAVTIAS